MTLPARCFRIIVYLLFLGVFTPQTLAQTYPTKPIRFIVGYAPGGPNDILARLVGKKVSESLSVPVTVDNRPGADSIIATEMAARSAPDGYTIVIVSASSTIHPSVYARMSFDLTKDFSAVTTLASSTFVVVVNPALPVGSIKDLVALAKAKPGQINFASSGVGGTLHLTPLLGILMPSPTRTPPAIDAQQLREPLEYRLRPQRRESIQTHGAAMKAIEQLVVEARL